MIPWNTTTCTTLLTHMLWEMAAPRFWKQSYILVINGLTTDANTDSQYFIFLYEGAPFRPGAHLYKAGAITTQILLIEKGNADVYTATDLCNMPKVWRSCVYSCDLL